MLRAARAPARPYEARESPGRRRFTIAHEVGHWLCQVLEGHEAPIFCRPSEAPDGKTCLPPAGMTATGVRRRARESPISDAPLGEALADLIEERRMTQAELADRAGVSRGYVSQVVNRVATPSRGTIEAFARALGVDPHYFVEIRLARVLRSVEASPARLDELFEELLTSAERRAWARVPHADRPFGVAVRQLMEQRDVCVDDLADDLDVASTYLQGVVGASGRRPSRHLVERAADVLGVAPEYFAEYRLHLVEEWLRDDQRRLDEHYAALGPLDLGPTAAERPPCVLVPYASWPVRRLPSPDVADRHELVRVLVEIVSAEGPVLGTRGYRLYAQGAGIRWVNKAVRSPLNRAAVDAIRRGLLVAVDELGARTQKDLVLRLPGTPAGPCPDARRPTPGRDPTSRAARSCELGDRVGERRRVGASQCHPKALRCCDPERAREGVHRAMLLHGSVLTESR